MFLINMVGLVWFQVCCSNGFHSQYDEAFEIFRFRKLFLHGDAAATSAVGVSWRAHRVVRDLENCIPIFNFCPFTL